MRASLAGRPSRGRPFFLRGRDVARIRTIKPEFFTSLTIDRLSLTAQRTFVGLWTYCDDEGRGLDDARLVKAAIWPLRDKHTASKVERDLRELAKNDLIIRYTVRDTHLLQVRAWNEHQKINKPSKSKHPPHTDDSATIHVGLPEPSRGERNREQGTGNGKGKEHESSPTGTQLPQRGGRSLSSSEQFADHFLVEIQEQVNSGFAHNLSEAISGVYTDAWQQAVSAPDLNPKVVGTRLVAAWLRAMDVEPDWGRLTKLVAQWGKLSLRGLEAGMKNNPDDPYSYAWSVCQHEWDARQAEVST